MTLNRELSASYASFPAFSDLKALALARVKRDAKCRNWTKKEKAWEAIDVQLGLKCLSRISDSCTESTTGKLSSSSLLQNCPCTMLTFSLSLSLALKLHFSIDRSFSFFRRFSFLFPSLFPFCPFLLDSHASSVR